MREHSHLYIIYECINPTPISTCRLLSRIPSYFVSFVCRLDASGMVFSFWLLFRGGSQARRFTHSMTVHTSCGPKVHGITCTHIVLFAILPLFLLSFFTLVLRFSARLLRINIDLSLPSQLHICTLRDNSHFTRALARNHSSYSNGVRTIATGYSTASFTQQYVCHPACPAITLNHLFFFCLHAV